MSVQRITFLITEFGPGGAETQVLRLALSLKRRGRDVRVISMLPPFGFVDQLEQAQIPFHTLAMRRGRPRLGDLWRAVSLLREHRPDVLVCFLFHANILGSIAGRIAGVPLIVTSIRGENFGSRNRENVERGLGMLRLHDVATTNSSIVAAGLIKRKIATSETMVVIPNGIMLDDFHPPLQDLTASTRAALAIDPHDFLWLAVGNVLPAKDYPGLLRAFARLLKRFPNARLRIAGALWDEDVKRQTSGLLEQLGLDDRVCFLGPRGDVPALLHAADAFVLSSNFEGMPNAIMEAMAAGLPVVATSVGGVPELLIQQVTGLLTTPGDVGALAEAMGEMMTLSKEQREQMALGANLHIRQQFGIEAVVDRWVSLFESKFPVS
ncbi:MAG: glycosyltransferase [Bradymonadaceae bacterium]|nr:glycosyltransferase [Lujinxingiaceae bacterium]